MNRKFQQSQTSDLQIRKMITLISIREFEIFKHRTNEYVITSIYFSKKNKNENVVMTKITRKTHLVNDLKINILIDNDFINSKKIVIDVVKEVAHIKNCNVNINIEVKTVRSIVREKMHFRKTINISPQFEMIISIHHIAISANRNFFFESDEFNFLLYAHIINAKIKDIIIQNDNNKIVHILRNCRLDHIMKFNYFNVFQIFKKLDAFNFALRQPFTNHKIN